MADARYHTTIGISTPLRLNDHRYLAGVAQYVLKKSLVPENAPGWPVTLTNASLKSMISERKTDKPEMKESNTTTYFDARAQARNRARQVEKIAQWKKGRNHPRKTGESQSNFTSRRIFDPPSHFKSFITPTQCNRPRTVFS